MRCISSVVSGRGYLTVSSHMEKVMANERCFGYSALDELCRGWLGEETPLYYV